MVYEELVIVGKVFYTPDAYAAENEERFKDWESYRVPSLGILRTCKQVHGEAEEVYLANNLFVLPDESTKRQPFVGTGLCHNTKSVDITRTHVPFPDRWLFSASAPRLIKSISMGFSWRSIKGFPVLDRSTWKKEADFDSLAPAARLQIAHERALSYLNGDLDGYIEDLYRFFKYGGGPEFKRMNYLEFDLTNAFCPTGCCRMAEQNWAQMMFLGPRKTGFLGVRNEQEADIIMVEVYDTVHGNYGALHEDYEGKLEVDVDGIEKLFGIVFNPDKTHWEQWKVETK
ncbi:uncharacterized protein J4E87_006199 [Alternaria ethzedia]|uniref:uncharacterized protein n=1 Tax=Alternaria ethzedia TaxID=181014 RepID=UPI0020C22F53|nr:uncharacterized protein J4E87_006199 [Alternaria ethzedia]KAI4622632.1 hypothetical protein J4E87_006199 [Alternaria ethzedia]